MGIIDEARIINIVKQSPIFYFKYNKMTKHLEIILRKMCSKVHADYDEINFQEDNWYWKYEWTREEEESFTEWLKDYLMSSKEARKEIMSLSGKNKDMIDKTAKFFVMNYGWKTKTQEYVRRPF